MAKILFINGNLHGHINPTLPIITELVHRGNEVYYFSTGEFRTKLEAAGAVFMDYGDEFDRFVQTFRPHGNHPFYTLMEYMLALDRTVIPIILRKVYSLSFDCIIHDVMFGGGKMIAQKLKLPVISSCSSFVMEKPPLPERMLEPGFHPQLDYLLGQLEEAAKEWESGPLTISGIFFKKEPVNLVYTSRLFQPQGDHYEDIYRFVGPSITDRKEVPDFTIDAASGQKLIYISLGTVLNNSIDFYKKCIEAFRDTDWQVILSVGSKTELSQLQPCPSNFIIRNYIPQLEVLKHASLMISHGGLNSVSEAFYYGVPVLAIPLANDQSAVAKQITALGAGLTLKAEEVTPALLRSTAAAIITEESYQLHVQEIRSSFLQAGGYRKAADLITEYIGAI